MLPLLCLLAGLAATVTGACEAPFTVVGEGCYYYSLGDDIKLQWTDARQYCQSLGSEVDLAVLDYVCDDFRNLGNYMLLQGALLGYVHSWIGATGFDDTWFWVDGRSLSTASPYWFPGDPASLGNECALIAPYTDDVHPMRITLVDEFCYYNRSFICQDFSAALQL